MTKKQSFKLDHDMKILHVEVKRAKNGARYYLVHALIELNGQEYVRRFAMFYEDKPAK